MQQLDDMEETKTQNGRGRPKGDFSEFGTVRVISKPAPDAEDRLRRLFTLLLRTSASDEQGESGKDTPAEYQRVDNHPEGKV